MDLERSIGGRRGVPELYQFTQTPTTCVISFTVKPGVKPQVTINSADSTILVIGENNSLIVCGVTYGKFFKNTYTVSNNIYTITLFKEERVTWPLLIIKHSSHGIDMKSLYVIGLSEDASGNYKSAFEYYKKAAKEGFIPAKVLVADILMSDINNYDVERNVDEGISLLESIPVERMTTEVVLCLTRTLISKERKEEAARIFKNYLSIKDDHTVAIEYAHHLSPFADGTMKNPEEAVMILQGLSEKENTEAMRLLAQHYYKGVGVKADKKLAKELDQRACEINEELTPLYGKKGIGKNIAIAAGVSTVFVGAFAAIYKRLSK